MNQKQLPPRPPINWTTLKAQYREFWLLAGYSHSAARLQAQRDVDILKADEKRDEADR